MRKIKERIKEKQKVFFETYKTGHFASDTNPKYEETLADHFKDDTHVDKKKVRSIKIKCNNHIKQFNKMFCVGASWGHQKRVTNATTSTNVPPPPLYGLRKDHNTKPHPVRPVCSANQAPNSWLGHFLCNVINDYVGNKIV